MEYDFYLRSASTGLYYTGEAGENWVAKPSLDHPPFGFTCEGACRKAAIFNNGGFALRDFCVTMSID